MGSSDIASYTKEIDMGIQTPPDEQKALKDGTEVISIAFSIIALTIAMEA